jgi:hypothetical protein
MDLPLAMQTLRPAEELLADLERTLVVTTTSDLISAVEKVSGIVPILAAIDKQARNGGVRDPEMRRILESISGRCKRILAICDGGAQYCSNRLNMLSIPVHGYGPPGQFPVWDLHGAVTEEG